MGIENGAQVLPTNGFDECAETTDEEQQEYEDQVNNDQIVPEEDQLEVDDPTDVGDGNDVDIDDVDGEEDEYTTEEEVEIDDGNGEAATPAESAAPAAPAKAERAKGTKKEEYERYSRGVQRRINKEVKQREHLKAELEEQKQRFNALEAKLQTRDDTNEADIIANRIKNATAVKRQYLEDGEYDKVTKVDDDLFQMKLYQAKLEERAQQQDYQAPQAPGQQQPVAQYPQNAEQGQQPQGPVNIPNAQTNWIKGNPRFGPDIAYTNYVNQTYDAMLDEGYDPESQTMYQELNRRTGTKPLRTPKPANTAASAKPRPQAAPSPNTGQVTTQRAGVKGLTEADKHNMRNWGIDPNDKAARKEWLSNKRK